jgi:hypothetical protein
MLLDAQSHAAPNYPGLRQYRNEDILLLGGYSRSGSTSDGTSEPRSTPAASPFWIRLGRSFKPRPPTWDALYRLRTERTAGQIVPPPDEADFIPASRPRPDGRSPD